MGVTKYPDEQQPQLRQWLERGWTWLEANLDHTDAEATFNEWLGVLSIYEKRYGGEVDDVANRGDSASARVNQDDGEARRARAG